MRSEATAFDLLAPSRLPTPARRDVVAIAQLAAFARRSSAHMFCQRFGPVALLSKPAPSQLRLVALQCPVTVHNGQGPEYLDDLLIMLRGFRTLRVSFLNPLASRQTFRVGRDDQSDVALQDPSVSKQHASFVWTGTTWHLHDDRSLNGTFVNSDLVPATGLEVSNGDTVGFGDALAVFIETRTLHSQLISLPSVAP